jgi:AraC-like DNA-binding protein
MRYQEFQPAPPVNKFVECFWTLEGGSDGKPVEPQRILPDGCAELVLNFGARFIEHKENGDQELQPFHFLVGQMTRPILIAPTGDVQLLGIRFHPGGTMPFLRYPMHEVTNRVVALGQLHGALEREFLARTGDAPLLRGKIAALQHWFTQLLNDGKHDSRLLSLTAKMVRLGGRLSLDELAAGAGISGRQLERKFLQEVGLGPKQLCRILRFQQVFRVVEQDHAGWSGVALDCGYFDQAHLIRDFREFAWQTPAVLLAHPNSLTEAFSRKHRTSDFSNTHS